MNKLEDLKDKYYDEDGNMMLTGGLQSYMNPQNFVDFANKHNFSYHKSFGYLDETMLEEVEKILKNNRQVVVAAWYEKNSTDVYLEPLIGGSKSNKSSGGCFIATACYGSYSSPEVMVLRRFRDQTLRKSSFGNLCVRIYYKISPNIAIRIKNTKKTRAFILNYLLNPVVFYLKKNQDRE
jgi:hypothetical protein